MNKYYNNRDKPLVSHSVLCIALKEASTITILLLKGKYGSIDANLT